MAKTVKTAKTATGAEPLKLGILITGDTTGELKAQHGSFAAMFMDLFEQQGCRLAYQLYDLREMQFPVSIRECDAWLITGSEHGVYDQLPWMAPLQTLIRKIVTAQIPLIGICFGHQIMAAAFGARVEKSSKGWGLGPHRYQVLGKEVVQSVVINAMHQDQVMELPQGAELFLTSEFCPYAGFYYGPQALSIQAHPEFLDQYTIEQLLAVKGRVFPEVETDRAVLQLRSSEINADTALVAGWMIALLEQAGSDRYR